MTESLEARLLDIICFETFDFGNLGKLAEFNLSKKAKSMEPKDRLLVETAFYLWNNPLALEFFVTKTGVTVTNTQITLFLGEMVGNDIIVGGNGNVKTGGAFSHELMIIFVTAAAIYGALNYLWFSGKLDYKLMGELNNDYFKAVGTKIDDINTKLPKKNAISMDKLIHYGKENKCSDYFTGIEKDLLDRYDFGDKPFLKEFVLHVSKCPLKVSSAIMNEIEAIYPIHSTLKNFKSFYVDNPPKNTTRAVINVVFKHLAPQPEQLVTNTTINNINFEKLNDTYNLFNDELPRITTIITNFQVGIENNLQNIATNGLFDTLSEKFESSVIMGKSIAAHTYNDKEKITMFLDDILNAININSTLIYEVAKVELVNAPIKLVGIGLEKATEYSKGTGTVAKMMGDSLDFFSNTIQQLGETVGEAFTMVKQLGVMSYDGELITEVMSNVNARFEEFLQENRAYTAKFMKHVSTVTTNSFTEIEEIRTSLNIILKETVYIIKINYKISRHMLQLIFLVFSAVLPCIGSVLWRVGKSFMKNKKSTQLIETHHTQAALAEQNLNNSLLAVDNETENITAKIQNTEAVIDAVQQNDEAITASLEKETMDKQNRISRKTRGKRMGGKKKRTRTYKQKVFRGR